MGTGSSNPASPTMKRLESHLGAVVLDGRQLAAQRLVAGIQRLAHGAEPGLVQEHHEQQELAHHDWQRGVEVCRQAGGQQQASARVQRRRLFGKALFGTPRAISRLQALPASCRVASPKILPASAWAGSDRATFASTVAMAGCRAFRLTLHATRKQMSAREQAEEVLAPG